MALLRNTIRRVVVVITTMDIIARIVADYKRLFDICAELLVHHLRMGCAG
jgi:hypothetical protein